MAKLAAPSRRFRVGITTAEAGSHHTTVRAASAGDAVVKVLTLLWLFEEPNPETFLLSCVPLGEVRRG